MIGFTTRARARALDNVVARYAAVVLVPLAMAWGLGAPLWGKAVLLVGLVAVVVLMARRAGA